jgi:hypothetical protein
MGEDGFALGPSRPVKPEHEDICRLADENCPMEAILITE